MQEMLESHAVAQHAAERLGALPPEAPPLSSSAAPAETGS